MNNVEAGQSPGSWSDNLKEICQQNFSLLFFGDSIATGQGVPVLTSWPLLVAEALGRVEGRVFVSAVNGETTRDALYRLEKNVLSMGDQLDVFFMQYGINDGNFWESGAGFPRVSQESFQANLHEIIERVFGAGIDTVILGTNHPVSKPLPVAATRRFGCQNLGESVRSYNAVIRHVAAQRGDCQLFDVEELFDDNAHLLADGVHLNEVGHRRYSDAFVRAFWGVKN